MAGYEVVRSITIGTDPARVHALLDDFHSWRAWSPWEDVDPDLQRTYTGSDRGVGAHYAWRGNRKAGQGWMEITGSTPERVEVALVFMKPFDAANEVVFELAPTEAGQTEVTWRMRGEQKGLWGFVGRFLNMDKLVGRDFDKGLARLKTAAEDGETG